MRRKWNVTVSPTVYQAMNQRLNKITKKKRRPMYQAN